MEEALRFNGGNEFDIGVFFKFLPLAVGGYVNGDQGDVLHFSLSLSLSWNKKAPQRQL